MSLREMRVFDSGRSRTDRPAVSIIVPVYQVESYLTQCLDSLVVQTLREIEIILIDDGSTDGSSAIVERYARDFASIVQAHRTVNRGLSAARNLGIELSTGEFIGFVDSDDWVDRNMFKTLYEAAKESDSDVVVCGAKKYLERAQKQKAIMMQGASSDYGCSISENPHILLSAKSFAWNKVFRRSLWVDNEFEFPPGRWYEDSAVIYNVLRLANRVEYVPDCFYYYRVDRPESITQSLSPKIFDIFESCDELIRFDKANPIDHPEMQRVFEVLVRNHIVARFDLLKERRSWAEKELTRKFLDRALMYLDMHSPDWRAKSELYTQNKARTVVRVCRGSASTLLFAYFPYSIRSRIGGGFGTFDKRRRSLLKRVRRRLRAKAWPRSFKPCALRVFTCLDDALPKTGAVYFADDATLLGLVRDGSITSNNWTVWIGVITSDEGKMDVDTALQEAGFTLRDVFICDNTIHRCTYDASSVRGCGRVTLDVGFYDVANGQSKGWWFYRDSDRRLGTNERSVVATTCAGILSATSVEVDGQLIPIPQNPDGILREEWGESWREAGWSQPGWFFRTKNRAPSVGWVSKGNSRLRDVTCANDRAMGNSIVRS